MNIPLISNMGYPYNYTTQFQFCFLQLLHLEGRGAFCFAALARKAPGASEEGRPACTAGGGLWRIFGKTGKPGFSGFGETVLEGSGFGLGEHRVGCLGW